MEEALAYRLMCSLYQRQEELLKIVPVAEFTTPENAARLPAVPLHPGAARYLREVASEGRAPLDCNA